MNILHKAGHHPSETFFLCYSCCAFAAVVLLLCLRISCEIYPIFSSSAVLKQLSHHAPISVNIKVIYVPQLLYLLVLYIIFLFQLMLEIQEQGSNTIIMNSTVLSTKLPLPKCGMLIRTITKLQSVANCLIHVLVQNGLFCSLITTL